MDKTHYEFLHPPVRDIDRTSRQRQEPTQRTHAPEQHNVSQAMNRCTEQACQYQITFHLSTNGPRVLQPVDNSEGEVIKKRLPTLRAFSRSYTEDLDANP